MSTTIQTPQIVRAFVTPWLLVALVVALAPSAAAQTTRWDEGLDGVEQALEEGKWQRAERRASKMVERIAAELGSYERPVEPLARAIAYLAVAEEGLGRREDALWHLAMARALEGPGRPMDTSLYGAPGRLLAEVSRRHVGHVPADWDDLPVDPFATPRPLETFLQSDIAGVLDYDDDRLPTDLEIELLVDSEGRPHLPVLVVPTRFPGFAVAAMESIRQWEFEPAMEGGEPVAALVTVTVAFPESRWRSRQFNTARIPCGARVH